MPINELINIMDEYEKGITELWSNIQQIRIAQTYFYRNGGKQVTKMTDEEEEAFDDAIDRLSGTMHFLHGKMAEREEVRQILEKGVNKTVVEVNPEAVRVNLERIVGLTQDSYELSEKEFDLLADFMNKVVENEDEIGEDADMIYNWAKEESEGWVAVRSITTDIINIGTKLLDRIQV